MPNWDILLLLSAINRDDLPDAFPRAWLTSLLDFTCLGGCPELLSAPSAPLSVSPGSYRHWILLQHPWPNWRITEQHPVRDLDDLDLEGCAALHNLILARGWQQSGRALDDLDRRTWWSSTTPATRATCSLPGRGVMAFLKAAQVGHLANTEDIHSFHRSLMGSNVPELLNDNVMFGPDEDDSNKSRYIPLYSGNPDLDPNHALGLLYDQVAHRAIHVESQDHAKVVENGRQRWLPLEVSLEAYLQMMDQGKIRVVGDDYEGAQEVAPPWIMPMILQGSSRGSSGRRISKWLRLRALERRM